MSHAEEVALFELPGGVPRETIDCCRDLGKWTRQPGCHALHDAQIQAAVGWAIRDHSVPGGLQRLGELSFFEELPGHVAPGLARRQYWRLRRSLRLPQFGRNGGLVF